MTDAVIIIGLATFGGIALVVLGALALDAIADAQRKGRKLTEEEEEWMREIMDEEDVDA
jgi:hypothetical protein